MLPQDWGSKNKGGLGELAVILWSKVVGLPLPSVYTGKGTGVKELFQERQRNSNGADFDAVPRKF